MWFDFICVIYCSWRRRFPGFKEKTKSSNPDWWRSKRISLRQYVSLSILVFFVVIALWKLLCSLTFRVFVTVLYYFPKLDNTFRKKKQRIFVGFALRIVFNWHWLLSCSVLKGLICLLSALPGVFHNFILCLFQERKLHNLEHVVETEEKKWKEKLRQAEETIVRVSSNSALGQLFTV